VRVRVLVAVHDSRRFVVYEDAHAHAHGNEDEDEDVHEHEDGKACG
jgi:hypothetical protein